jgi:hypothetical protein
VGKRRVKALLSAVSCFFSQIRRARGGLFLSKAFLLIFFKSHQILKTQLEDNLRDEFFKSN